MSRGQKTPKSPTMSELDYVIEPEVECLDNDATIGGHNDVEEYVVCKIYPLAAGFSFESLPLGTTPVSKVDTPLPLFVVGNVVVEYAAHVLAEVEAEAEKVLGSFGPKEYDTLCMPNILNDGRLNRVLE
jgi:hypothetical protein